MLNEVVDFELAKLLKEKEFDIPVLSCYFKKDEISENYSIINQYEHNYIEDKGNFLLIPYDNNRSLYLEKINFNGWGDLTLSAPTIAQVIDWLFIKHDIYIHISPHAIEDDYLKDCKWWFGIYKDTIDGLLAGSKITEGIDEFDSIQECYTNAIKYCLKNVI